jgi:F-type H+-transporting ATPase subunit delta
MAESELTTVARPYARAAFSRALDEDNGLEHWSHMVSLAAAAVQQELVQRALDNPLLTMDQEAQLVMQILGDDLSETGKNFISILAEYGRLSLLPHITELFEQLKAQHLQSMDVDIASAFDVDDNESSQLQEALARRLQKEIKLTTSVDKTLLGGVVIRAEDTVIDNSVRGKLEKLANTLS